MSAWDLRLGRWQDALADVEMVDAVITDPPYSARTEKGQRSGTVGCGEGPRAGTIRYGSVSEADVVALVKRWAPVTRRWFVMFGDHLSVRWALDALDGAGWYSFAPLAWAKTDAAPRLMSDGPSPGAEFVAVGRPRRRLDRIEKRFRPGWYHGPSRNMDRIVIGGKPQWLMRAIVRDYSEPGDLVCDPCAGGATTLLASVVEGRRAVGAEMDPDTYAKALARLERGHTPDLFAGVA